METGEPPEEAGAEGNESPELEGTHDISLSDSTPRGDGGGGGSSKGGLRSLANRRDSPAADGGELGGSPEVHVPENIAEYMDWAIEQVGGWNTFQRIYTVILSGVWILCGAQTLLHVFVTMPPHRLRLCTSAIDACEQVVFEEMDCSVPRSEYRFVDPDTSVISDFGLVCESAMYVPLLGTMFFLGFLLGASFFGGLADRRGRRRATFAALCTLEAGGLLSTISPGYTVYMVARVATGIGVGGLGLCSYVWLSEMLGVEARSFIVVTTNCTFALGVLVLSPMAYYVPQWRWLSFWTFLMGLPFLAIHRFLLESPKWLAGPGKQAEEAHAVLSRIAATNKRAAPPPPPIRASVEMLTGGAPPENKEDGPDPVRQLLTDERLCQRFWVLCFTWFALSFGYYGISLNVSNLGMSVYVSSAMAAIVELPMYPIALYLVDTAFAGRRGCTGCGLVCGGICCILCVLAVREAEGSPPQAGGQHSGARQDGSAAPDLNAALLILVFSGKAGVAMSFGVAYLYSAELFPTTLRTRSLGYMSLCARLGGMVAPLVADLSRISQALPLVTFGLPCVAAGLLLFGLPETRGKPMPGTIEDVPKPQSCLCLGRYRPLDEERLGDTGSSAQPATIGVPRA